VRKVLFTILLAALVAVPAASAGNGNGNGSGKARPLDPAVAQALASTPGSSGTSAVPVSKQEALAAMEQPGADVALAPGYATPQLAVAASTGCTAYQSWRSWGTWPYDQQVYDHTYYCVVTGSHITSRSTSVSTGGTLCGTESRSNWIVSGGIGYSWMVVHAEARFSCPTVIPWVTIHPTDWLETSYNAWGNAAQVNHS
jgi:hypothetical protein